MPSLVSETTADRSQSGLNGGRLQVARLPRRDRTIPASPGPDRPPRLRQLRPLTRPQDWTGITPAQLTIHEHLVTPWGMHVHACPVSPSYGHPGVAPVTRFAGVTHPDQSLLARDVLAEQGAAGLTIIRRIAWQLGEEVRSGCAAQLPDGGEITRLVADTIPISGRPRCALSRGRRRPSGRSRPAGLGRRHGQRGCGGRRAARPRQRPTRNSRRGCDVAICGSPVVM